MTGRSRERNGDAVNLGKIPVDPEKVEYYAKRQSFGTWCPVSEPPQSENRLFTLFSFGLIDFKNKIEKGTLSDVTKGTDLALFRFPG